jgi:hypothetical protein
VSWIWAKNGMVERQSKWNGREKTRVRGWLQVSAKCSLLHPGLSDAGGRERRSSGSILLLKEELAATSDDTGSLGGDEATLLSAGSVSSGGRGVTHVLMVTTTMGMLDGVHGDTSDSGPVSLLGVGLVVGGVGLEEGLVSSLTASDNADHGSAAAHDGLADAGRKSNSGLLAVLGVTDDDGGSAGSASKDTAVTELGLNVGDNGSLGHGVHGEDVADREGGY